MQCYHVVMLFLMWSYHSEVVSCGVAIVQLFQESLPFLCICILQVLTCELSLHSNQNGRITVKYFSVDIAYFHTLWCFIFIIIQVIQQYGGMVDDCYSDRITHILCDTQRTEVFQLVSKLVWTPIHGERCGSSPEGRGHGHWSNRVH